MTSFRDKMLEARPEIAAREAAFKLKIDLAMELRALRDAANLTQDEIATRSGLSRDRVEACEALSGEMPAPEDVAAYRSAAQKGTSSN